MANCPERAKYRHPGLSITTRRISEGAAYPGWLPRLRVGFRFRPVMLGTMLIAVLATCCVAEDSAGQTAPQPTPERVQLGGDDLVAGIPGEGPLTDEQIITWLADPKNHRPLRPVLPMGLADAANQVTGIRENPLTRAKIELGRQLYFDTRLSIDNTISCASCHSPDHGYAFDSRFGVGIEKLRGNRNSPVAYNRILSSKQFWDGRAESLEDQAVGPIANPIEMGFTHDACVTALKQVTGYVLQFDALFDDGLTIDNVGRAIASFERVIVTGPAPWDYQAELNKFEQAYAEDLEDEEYLREEDPQLLEQYEQLKAAAAEHPLSKSARRGAELFFSQRVGCAQCHAGANFTDELYHNLGVGMEHYQQALQESQSEFDWGRYAITGVEKERGAHKTPTLRNVAGSAPHMHDGSQKTLAEVVEWYAKGGHANPWLSDKVKKFEATEQDKRDLVEFMKALTGQLPNPERERLP